MMRLKRKPTKILCLLFACILTLSSLVLPVTAEDTISDLEDKTSDLQTELSDLNAELTSLSTSIDETVTQLETTTALVTQTKIELADAKANEAKQYEDMKSRIQYIYETGDAHVLELLFSASCIADFLNKADFITAISEYDREMLTELVKTHELIAEKETTLNEQQKTLTTLKTSLDEKSTALNDKITSTSADLSAYTTELERAKAAQAAAQAALEKKVEEEQRLAEERLQQQEDAKNNAAAKPPTTSGNGSYEADADELTLFAALLQAEAGPSDYEAVLAVASVVMNRVNHSKFPNTVRGVIYQSGQFSPTWNGSLDRILKRGASETCYQAARDALGGKNNIGNLLSFRAAGSTNRPGIIIGDNVFF